MASPDDELPDYALERIETALKAIDAALGLTASSGRDVVELLKQLGKVDQSQQVLILAKILLVQNFTLESLKVIVRSIDALRPKK